MEGFNSGGGKPFKLPGHTLPGINQRMDNTNLEDGRPGSSALQFDAFQSEDKQREIAIEESQANMEGGSAANYKSALHSNDRVVEPEDKKTEEEIEEENQKKQQKPQKTDSQIEKEKKAKQPQLER